MSVRTITRRPRPDVEDRVTLSDSLVLVLRTGGAYGRGWSGFVHVRGGGLLAAVYGHRTREGARRAALVELAGVRDQIDGVFR